MLFKCRGELSTSGFFPFSVWFTSVKAADGGGWIWPTTTINTHQDAESCSTHTLAQVLRAAGDVPQNYRRESSTGPIAEPDGTSSIHQNHKYSSHWLQPQGFQGDHRIWWCHFFFFYIQWVLWDYSQFLARVAQLRVMQTSPLTGMKIASSRFNFDVGVI